MYIRLLRDDGRPLWVGVLLGLGIAGAFYFRGVKTAIVCAILAVHSVLWRRARLWRRRGGALAAAAGSFAVAFVAPWMIHSTIVYDGPLGHLEAWVGDLDAWAERRSTGQSPLPLGVHNGLGAWWDVLIGPSH